MERDRERGGKEEKAHTVCALYVQYCGRVMTRMAEDKPGRQKGGGI